MKRLVFLMMFGLCLMCASAQNTKIVRGAVIDRNGNPIPNALVEATGGAESVTTDADGTFSMEVPIWLKSMTAQYAGMRPKKLNLEGRSELLFELKPEYKYKWFVNLIGTVNFGDDLCYGSIGAMGGVLAKWGGYLKIAANMGTDYDAGLPSVTAGVIKSISKSFYGYFGAGAAPIYKYYSYTSSSYFGETRMDGYGAMIDLGFIYNYKNIDFSLGGSIILPYEVNGLIQFGVGYVF